MRRAFRGRAEPVMAFTLGLLIATAGTATAARLITGKQIKNGSISSEDLSKGIRVQLAKAGVPGARGETGPRGDSGAPGSSGPQGPGAVRIEATVPASGALTPTPVASQGSLTISVGCKQITSNLFGVIYIGSTADAELLAGATLGSTLLNTVTRTLGPSTDADFPQSTTVSNGQTELVHGIYRAAGQVSVIDVAINVGGFSDPVCNARGAITPTR